MKKDSLGEFEQLVLLGVLRLDERAYAAEIIRELGSTVGRRVSRGALYATLERLERKGFLKWRIEAATSERGGFPKRRFEVTQDGVRVLRESRRALQTLWNGLEELLEGRGR